MTPPRDRPWTLGRGRRLIAAYSLMSGAMTMLWLSFAAITSQSARRYGVSLASIGLLAEIFPLFYVLLAIPAGHCLHRSLHPVLNIAVTVAAGGAVLRFAGGTFAGGAVLRFAGRTFAGALAGHAPVAVAQPVILSAAPKLVSVYLPPEQRAQGLARTSAVNFLGLILALALAPILSTDGHLGLLLGVEAALTIAAALWFGRALSSPELPRALQPAAVPAGGVRSLLHEPQMRVLCGIVAVGFGVFALSAWTQELLKPAGVSQKQAGILFLLMVLAGALGCATVAPAGAGRHAERHFLRSATFGIFVACVTLGVAPWLGLREAALIGLGVCLLPGLPIVLSLAERVAASASGSAGAAIWLAGNIGGLVVALLVQSLVHHPEPAFLALAAVSLRSLPLSARLTATAPARPFPEKVAG